MGPMFKLTLRQMAGRRRLVLILLLAALPVGLAVILRIFASGDEEFTENFISTIVDAMIIAIIMPIAIMTLATSAFGNELEDRTLNVLVLKPVSRFSIVLPKLLGSIIVVAPLMAVAGIAVMVIGLEQSDGPAIIATGVALIAGVITYAAMFTWAGLLSSRALGFAVVYVFLWEGLLSTFLSGIRYLSVRGYTLAIIHGLDEETFATISDRVIEFPAAIVGAALVTVLFTYLTVRRLQSMDVQ
jgi:ABC-2 type transport system permease protein